MLVIRPAHMQAFDRNAEAQFLDQLAEHLRLFLPSRGVHVPAAALRQQVELGYAVCPQFKLELQSDIARFCEIICGMAGGFSSDPLPIDAQRILLTYRQDPAMKLDRLQAWAEKQSLPGKTP